MAGQGGGTMEPLCHTDPPLTPQISGSVLGISGLGAHSKGLFPPPPVPSTLKNWAGKSHAATGGCSCQETEMQGTEPPATWT